MSSGLDFQYKIEERVQAKGWDTFPEQSYIDDVELKPRDNDFIAIQEGTRTNPRGNQIALVVECKYLPSDVSVHMRPNPNQEDAYFLDGYSKIDLFRDKSRFHIFNAPKVATNIIKDSDKKDNLGSAIIQAIKALLYFRGSGRKLHAKGLFYPVVVYGGPGKIVDQDGTPLDNFLYYRSYEWKEPHSQDRAVTRYLYVDVIRENDLEHYLDDIFLPERNVVIGHDAFREMIARRDNIDRQFRRQQNPGR